MFDICSTLLRTVSNLIGIVSFLNLLLVVLEIVCLNNNSNVCVTDITIVLGSNGNGIHYYHSFCQRFDTLWFLRLLFFLTVGYKNGVISGFSRIRTDYNSGGFSV